MSDTITYYDWVPFFGAVCNAIYEFAENEEEREDRLLSIAQTTFRDNHNMLKNGVADPFTYVYALAQRNTVNQKHEIFGNAARALEISAPLPSDWVFPTPTPHSKSSFYAKGKYIDREGGLVGNDCLWSLFQQAFSGNDLNEEDFLKVLSLKNVRITKLSQVLFLIAPDRFMPLDKQMNSLPGRGFEDLKVVAKKIEEKGLDIYLQVADNLKLNFPGCKLKEINLFNVITHDHQPLKLTGRFCQISSWADGQNQTDYFDDFVAANAVWTGGPTSSGGKITYQLTEVGPGDIVLVRRGTKNLGGIGLIVKNNYLSEGYKEGKNIQIIWLVKDDRKIEGSGLGQMSGFSHLASDKTIEKFRETYPETFGVIETIRQEQKIMIDHSSIRHKNLILQGPPGTGKTRLAKFLAEYLVSNEEKEFQSLIQVAKREQQVQTTIIEKHPRVKLIQFHPSFSYEDLVRGIRADVVDEGKLTYRVENRLLAKFAEKAMRNPHDAYVFIIDEINRANLPSVLGELIYALEYRGESIETLYELDGEREISIPHNLYIIGTMNTADRSVGHMDYAIRRRFAFIPVKPDVSVLPEEGPNRQLFMTVQRIFKEYTSSDFEPEDIQVGHSYFLGDATVLPDRLEYEIRPLLLEYIRDGVLSNKAKEVVMNLTV